jgi:serine/threonine-protein kinase RsbW
MNWKMLKLRSTPTSISKIEAYVRRVATEYSINDTKYPDILISVTEAVNNAIIHGNRNDQSKFVDVNVQRVDSGISFKISDQGRGFNPSNVPDPTAPDRLECCGGRGVYIIKELSDNVEYLDNGRTVEIQFDL